jgi:hypothetical protein
MGPRLGCPALLAVAVAVAGVTLAASTARAGKTRFGWITDTETLPQRAVELESWVLEQDGKGDPATDQTLVWWAPVIGLTDRVELALPVEIAFNRTATTSSTQLLRFGAELRWRLVDPDPVEAGPFAALLRFATKRPVTARDVARFEGEVVLSYDAGPVHFGADGTAIFDVNTDAGDTGILVRTGAGLSVLAVGEFRVGAEVFAEIQARGVGTDWVAAGPNVAFSHGRSWLSGAFLIGIEHIDLAPRLIWAIAF